MNLELSYGVAVLAGALSFLSPCVLPLVPPYLCFMAGVSSEELRSQTLRSRRQARLIGAAFLFVLGFATVFVALGVGASSIGMLLRRNLDWLGLVAGVAIIVMGLNFLGWLRLGFLSRDVRWHGAGKPRSFLGSYVMGLAFAFGWTPCIGPVLGAILGLAGSRQTSSEGALMLAFYSAGLGIPFILSAAFSGVILAQFARLRVHMHRVEQAMGALLVITGIAFLTGGMQALSFWLLETFPRLQAIG